MNFYDGYHFWGMHMIWWIIWIILIIWVYTVLTKLPKDTPLDILKKRFAKGEIDKEEYVKLKSVLEDEKS